MWFTDHFNARKPVKCSWDQLIAEGHFPAPVLKLLGFNSKKTISVQTRRPIYCREVISIINYLLVIVQFRNLFQSKIRKTFYHLIVVSIQDKTYSAGKPVRCKKPNWMQKKPFQCIRYLFISVLFCVAKLFQYRQSNSFQESQLIAKKNFGHSVLDKTTYILEGHLVAFPISLEEEKVVKKLLLKSPNKGRTQFFTY